MKKQLSLLTILLIFSIGLFAQNNVMLMTNGKKLTVGDYKIIGDSKGDSLFIFSNAKGKEKEKYLDELFSITDADGKERILYKQNMAIGEILTKDQMKSYVLGRFDGNETKISPLIGISALGIGVGAAFMPNPEINTSNSSIPLPIGVLIPAAHAVIVGSIGTSEKVLENKFPNRINDEYYIMGVDQSLRKKRVRHTLLLGFLGFAATTITIAAVN